MLAFKTGSWTIDGVACSPFLWKRFSFKRTAREGGSKLFDDVILNNFTNLSMPGPWSHLDLVKEIAKSSEKTIPVAQLSPALGQKPLPRGRIVFGFPGKTIDQIAFNYPHMIWWVSKDGLIIDVAHGHISEFDELVGRALFQAPRMANGRLGNEVLLDIAKALDLAGFNPVRNLTGECRKKLADWNQKHPRKAIHSFRLALKCDVPNVSAGIKKHFYRALETYTKAYPELSRQSGR